MFCKTSKALASSSTLRPLAFRMPICSLYVVAGFVYFIDNKKPAKDAPPKKRGRYVNHNIPYDLALVK